jgi:glycosyltransferase involved in cell wall biosynthesis
MKILVNLLPIKQGGGQQVAFNFLNILSSHNFDASFHILATQGTYIAQKLTEKSDISSKLAHTIIPDSIPQRFSFENFGVNRLVKKEGIDAIFTLFGPSLKVRGVPSITGCAYSNLFFPEIQFWHGSWFNRTSKALIDKYRLKKTLQADALVFENNAMLLRAEKLFGVKHAVFIKPSISLSQEAPSVRFHQQKRNLAAERFKILMLAGWHPNKRLDIVPDVLASLKKNHPDVQAEFILTVAPEASESQALMQRATALGVVEKIRLVGQVSTADVPHMAAEVQAFGLFSLLESFSNNIIEAWAYNRPLIVADEEWARAICNDAAVYIDRNSADDIADKIAQLARHEAEYKRLVAAGKAEIETYPTPFEKVEQQIKFVKSVCNVLAPVGELSSEEKMKRF